jgi:hypothetical protein
MMLGDMDVSFSGFLPGALAAARMRRFRDDLFSRARLHGEGVASGYAPAPLVSGCCRAAAAFLASNPGLTWKRVATCHP